MEWTLLALIVTWTLVIPYLVLFPPQLIFVRRKLRASRDLRAIRSISLDPKWQITPPTPSTGAKNNSSSAANNSSSFVQSGLPRWVIPANSQIVIALVNRKSGGQLGAATLTALSKLLKPDQIFDLAENPDIPAILRSFTGNFKVLICGGDGTVSWAMDAATKSGCRPPMAILPLGTGNDLSRSLNWGAGFGMGEVTVDEVRTVLARMVTKSALQRLDRWMLTITPTDGSPVLRRTMINYFSFGVDAEISLKFHHERLEYPERFSSQTKNVVKYAMLGFEAAFDGKMLEGNVQVFAGGKQLELMDGWKGAIVSNVPCYHGGKNFWGTTTDEDGFGPALMDDGTLEVMGLAGTFHIGLCNIHVDSALRVGQHGQISVVLKEACAVQIDGEPFLQSPATVDFMRIDQYPMLKCIA